MITLHFIYNRSTNMNYFIYTSQMNACLVKDIEYVFLVLQALLLSKDALLKFRTGHVMDLISNDVQRMEGDTVMLFFDSFFSSFVLLVSALLLVYLIGWQSLIGLFFLCFLLPYFAGFSHISAKLRLRTALETDRRISLMNQAISGIRAIKTRTWEDEYRTKIEHTRR